VEAEETTVLPQRVGIRARSQREAMDWSLVLASQGIAPVIQYQPRLGVWMLVVSRAEFDPAMAAIRQYHRENRGWHWRQQLAASEFTFHWGGLLWCWGLILFHWWGWAWPGWLEWAGAMNDRVADTGQWWRLFTATTLHADLGHLAANAATGVFIMGLAMGRYGAGWTFLAATLAGGLGNLLGLWLRHSAYIGLGASGVVMGALGMLAVYSFGLFRRVPGTRRQILAGLGGGVLLFILMGASPASDMLAHAGGFVGGMGLGMLLTLLPPAWRESARANLIAGLITGLGLAVAWVFALSV
jgi:membrane associated rhomboid family serine protease